MKVRDRIKELRRVKASTLIPHPSNWRTHGEAQMAALAGILEEIGFAGAELVLETPEGLMLIDGHARRDLAGDEIVPVLVTDLSEAEAKLMLAAFDPISAMADADAVKLDALLREVDTGSEALQEMLAELATSAGLYLDETTADANESEDNANDGFVSFALGDYKGKVSKAVYDSFSAKYKKLQKDTAEPLLDDVLRAWLKIKATK